MQLFTWEQLTCLPKGMKSAEEIEMRAHGRQSERLMPELRRSDRRLSGSI